MGLQWRGLSQAGPQLHSAIQIFLPHTPTEEMSAQEARSLHPNRVPIHVEKEKGGEGEEREGKGRDLLRISGIKTN